MGGTSSSDNATIINSAFDPVTRRLLVDSAGGGSGTVTSITAGTGLTATPTNPITTSGTILLDSKLAPLDTLGTALQYVRVNSGATALEYATLSGGTGTVTTVSVASANGFAGTVANATTTPAITITTTITSPVLAGNGTAISAATVTGTGSTVVLGTSPSISGATITTSTVNGVTLTTGGGTTTFLNANGAYSTPAGSGGLIVGTTTITSGSTGNIEYNNAGVLGEYTITGSGTVVAMQTSPNFLTSITGNSNSILTFPAAATWKFGAADAASPVAQSLKVQNVVAGTSNTVGTSLTISGSQGTGTGTGGSIILQTAPAGTTGTSVNPLTNAVTILGNGDVGVGTSTPNAPLQVGVNGGSLYVGDTTNLDAYVNFNGRGFVGLDHTNNNMAIQGVSTKGVEFNVNANTFGAGIAMLINSSGLVGIGTTTIGSSLQINGGVAVGYSSSQAAPTNGLIVSGHVTLEGVTSTGATGTGNIVFSSSPTFTTPTLGAATATTINGNTITAGSSTYTGTAAATYTFPGASATIAGLGTTQTFTGQDKFNNIIDVNNAVTVTSNAGTVPVTFRLNTFTNSSAATMAITMATASAVDGQMTIVRIYDFSAVAQTIGWTNTENSTVSVPTTSNGSTTLPLTVGFMYNAQTSKWRCIALA